MSTVALIFRLPGRYVIYNTNKYSMVIKRYTHWKLMLNVVLSRTYTVYMSFYGWSRKQLFVKYFVTKYAKTAKVFPLKCFAIYGIASSIFMQFFNNFPVNARTILTL